ncbi:MAG: CRISPR-associated endoribonuclease Cas6 [Capsulimonadaceae bacterium]|nr:CRISPR-associated endoribonuclease Cas6 [Capsulimonadaceae bacterium]
MVRHVYVIEFVSSWITKGNPMRLQIYLTIDRPFAIPIDYQAFTSAAIYSFVSAGDVDYGHFVHDEGYVVAGKAFKPFTHSWLRIPASARRIVGDQLRIAPGAVEWVVSSPLDDFLQPFASGLLQSGSLRVGNEELAIREIAAVPAPEITESMRLTCLSPIVASTRRPDGSTQFLRPSDGPAVFSEAIRKNLVAKHAALFGAPPVDDRLEVVFDPEYLARRGGGTKLTRYKGTDIIGILAPFTATGSTELIRLGYDAGFGTRGAQGFGCVEVRQR